MVSLFEKLLRFKALQWKDGKLYVVNIPGLLSAFYIIVYQQRLLEKECKTKAISILYNIGKFQGKQAFKIFSEGFGYMKKMNKKQLLEFNTTQGEFGGLGKYKWIKIDFENDLFVFRGKSTLAEEYKRFFGIQRETVDHMLRGMITAFIEEITGKKMFTLETSCIATGKSYCEFITKPIGNWNKKDTLVKTQLIKDLPDMKKLGAQIEPYLALSS